MWAVIATTSRDAKPQRPAAHSFGLWRPPLQWGDEALRMNWFQHLGRIVLAVGVIAIGLWATANKLLDMPVHTFWTGILSYLIAAEVIWTLVARGTAGQDNGLPRRGLLKLSRWDRGPTALTRWFHETGRVRMADLVAHSDSPREALAAVYTATSAPVSCLRLHVLTGAPGSGRSTFLYRLGRRLVDEGQSVYLLLSAPEFTGLEQVLDAARRHQVVLLIDDLDLRPEAEEWLYELERSGLPVVVIATMRPLAEDDGASGGLDVVQPASLISRATTHDISVTHNDIVALSRKLGTHSNLQRVGLALEETNSLLAAARAFRGLGTTTGLWQGLEAGLDLPVPHKLMVALVGCAEMSFSPKLWLKLFGPGSPARWQRAGLAVDDYGWMLPPHRLACLDHLTTMGLSSTAVAEALDTLCRAALPLEPVFVARLLYSLAQWAETRDVARACAAALTGEAPLEAWPEATQRLWRRAVDALDLLPSDAPVSLYPPELSLLMHSAYARGRHDQVLALARQLRSEPIYANAARLAAALALARQGSVAAAEEELGAIKGGVAGAHYMRGVLAEMQGDVLRALDAYEASRKADELQLSSTRALAFAYIKAGAPRSALPLFGVLLAYHPLDAELYAGLAVAHLHAGMAQRSAAQSARAIQAGVDPLVARKSVARACAQVHAYGRAAPELEACLSYDDQDPEVWQALAVACRWLGRFGREEECLRRLQEQDPDNHELRLDMARCRRDQGDAAEAFSLLQPLLDRPEPDLRALLLAAEVTGGEDQRDRQQELARQALQRGDDGGWGHYWLGDSTAELDEAAATAYRTAIQRMRHEIDAGATPRHTATLWQAICLAASRLGDETLATQAARRASQEAAICEALGAEIHSVYHRRAVPADVFTESLPPYNGRGGSAKPTPPEVAEKGSIRPIVTPAESSLFRNRRLRGSGV